MGPARLPVDAVFDLWDRVALTAEEDRVVEALRLIEPPSRRSRCWVQRAKAPPEPS